MSLKYQLNRNWNSTALYPIIWKQGKCKSGNFLNIFILYHPDSPNTNKNDANYIGPIFLQMTPIPVQVKKNWAWTGIIFSWMILLRIFVFRDNLKGNFWNSQLYEVSWLNFYNVRLYHVQWGFSCVPFFLDMVPYFATQFFFYVAKHGTIFRKHATHEKPHCIMCLIILEEKAEFQDQYPFSLNPVQLPTILFRIVTEVLGHWLHIFTVHVKLNEL